ncbi:hypothetical protein KY284_033172 [Solanum tuberosum]|nr:hypothetical protein KY284_033172 [Solanum tuberosum]
MSSTYTPSGSETIPSGDTSLPPTSTPSGGETIPSGETTLIPPTIATTNVASADQFKCSL